MAKASRKRAPSEAPEKKCELADEIAAFTRRGKTWPAARRRLVSRLLARGWGVPEIVAALHSSPGAVRRDLQALRRQAAERPLATDPGLCAALVLEDAEDVIRKVRRLQDDFSDDEKKSTLYHNLLKLEWSMLVKLFDVLTGRAVADEEETDEAKEDWTKLPYPKLRELCRRFHVDVEGLERSLGAPGGAPHDDGEAGTPRAVRPPAGVCDAAPPEHPGRTDDV